jgi:hypothetical protein
VGISDYTPPLWGGREGTINLKFLEQENDFIKREIQKLAMVLNKLIDKTASAHANTFETVVF